AKLHVIHNKKNGESLVVTNKPPKIQLSADSKVTVVTVDEGIDRINEWLERQGAKTAENIFDLLEAFKERNAAPEHMNNHALVNLLIDPSVKAYSPTMLDHAAGRGV